MSERWPLEVESTAILATGQQVECHLVANILKPHAEYELRATLAGEQAIEVTWSDLFGALLAVRRELDLRSVRLCCAGSRRDVWASGMQRDLGQGLRAYILTLPRRPERPASVGIFDPIAAELVATVAEQEQFYKHWLASPTAS